MRPTTTPDLDVDPHPVADEVLTPEAVRFAADLERHFGGRRRSLLAARRERRRRIAAGERPELPPASSPVRSGSWQVAPPPPDLSDRRVEITGPVDRKMMINALSCGARVFMADFEDATAPSWHNIVTGQRNLRDAVAGTISLEQGGRTYHLGDEVATLMVRPRGWHLDERHVRLGGRPVSASLFDFGLAVHHNARTAAARGTGSYFYLPKLEGHLEARLWNDVFCYAEDRLGLDRGAIRATVLVEHILAAFEMEEILYELRDHSAGLNAGRWDYIFSVAKTFAHDPTFVLPDRSQVTMTVPFMRAYTELLVATCHRRGAPAIGGMSAFVPNRRRPEVTEVALAQVSADKRREAADGFDGTWVAHPDLVPVAEAELDAVLGSSPNQIDRRRDDVAVDAGDLLAVDRTPGQVTDAGVRTNVEVGLRYLTAWLGGTGAVAIADLMEDAATAEISRAQLWRWAHHRVRTAEGTVLDAARVRASIDEVAASLAAGLAGDPEARSRLGRAREVFESVALCEPMAEFTTTVAYDLL